MHISIGPIVWIFYFNLDSGRLPDSEVDCESTEMGNSKILFLKNINW